jgi:uncharacterized ParB-like nuclease family protein
MAEERNWKRIKERLALQLPVRINCRETPDFEWSEVTRLINVTPFGAGFTLKRPTERGRLLHMTIPMPRQLRVYDHVEDHYRIWAIVRYLRGRTNPQASAFEVGVAFIGKRAPVSYESQPWKRYEISAGPFDKLAAVDETWEPGPRDESESHTQHNMAVDMRVELVDVNGAIIASEQTVTENISVQGASLFTTLDVQVGRFVRLTSDQYRVTAFAAIRSRTTGADGVARIHVEFVDRQWPL